MRRQYSLPLYRLNVGMRHHYSLPLDGGGRGGDDFHASLCPFQGVTVSGENSNSENASPPIERETRAISIVVAILTSMVSGVNIYVPKSR